MRLTESCLESRMRSRTSRGVPEWSRGKDLYMGSLILVAGKVPHFIGIVPGVPKGVRGSTKGVHQPRGATWAVGVCALAYMGQGNQPQEAHAPRYKKKGRVLKGEGTSEVPWGGWTPPPLGRTPSLEEGARLCLPPLPCPYIKGGEGRAAAPEALAPPSLP